MTTTTSFVRQTHRPAELDAGSWPIAAGTLPFPAVDRRGRTARSGGRAEWAARLGELAAAGFDHVEITDTWLRAGDLDKEELADLSAAGRELGLTIAAVALIRASVIDPVHGDDNLAYSHRAIEAAATLGAQVVSVGLHERLTSEQASAWWFWTRDHLANDPDDRELRALAVTQLRELGEHAGSLGMLLTLEMYEDTFLGSAESAIRLVEEIGRADVGLNPDTGNLIRLHRPTDPPGEVLAAVLPWSNYWHVKNYLRLEDPASGTILTAPTSMELGVIDYRDAIRSALDCGYAGIITCEHYGGDGLSVSAANQRYLRGLLKSVRR
ncbi:sugar phosphate isomerase/epimerase family protein [Kribbella solani]|uniref:Sugar phosphate isomerase/epimerase n=1 Tax=Kribbella solani TaxID=236067 RepID=A0A841DJZ1_9ACTN|nr:sugar phosphate isomerase/epimerase family protein [Kribbella solani]MBB5977395.1 sugar phosphate isomerase/epimerase [Kribbella solani]